MSKRTTKFYPLEFKQSSAQLAVESENPISNTAKELGINETTLYGWVAKFHPDRKLKPKPTESVIEENKLLRRENARLKQEREILKKAAAYFASEI